VRLETDIARFQARSRRPLISLTPLVDVVFILLVFFMLASSFSTEKVLEMLTPAPTESQADARAGAVLVRVGANGAIDLNGEPVTRSALAQQVAAWSVSESPRRYLVQPDAGVTNQQLVTILDLLKSSGAGSVSLTRR